MLVKVISHQNPRVVNPSVKNTRNAAYERTKMLSMGDFGLQFTAMSNSAACAGLRSIYDDASACCIPY